MADMNRMNGDRIKVVQLYYVRAASDLGSFSRAAATLGVTQPALSHGIAALERTLGGALFDRTTTGVTPTPLARRVLPHLHALLGSLDAMLTEAKAATSADAEPLRLGVSPIIHPGLVGQAFEAARGRLPASLVVQEKDLAELRRALLARRLDLLFVPAVPEAGPVRRREIAEEPLHYLPVDPDTWPAGPIDVRDLSEHSLVMVGDACGLTTMTRRLFADAGARLLPYAGEADSYRSVEDWAHLGLGGALLPLSRFQPGARTRPVHRDGQPVTIHYEAQWLAETPRAAAIEDLLERLVPT
jgi:DNA-binding transcriptional LysR family regulator